MNAVVQIETRRDPATSHERSAHECPAVVDPLAPLNEHIFTGVQMRAAVDAIKHVQIHSPADIAEHARLLREFSAAQGLDASEFAVASLHGRVIAMDKWCARHDPHGQSDVDAFFTAAGRQALISADGGVGFEPVSFRELIAFIAEMPY